MTEQGDDPYLDTEKVASRVGLPIDTIRIYLKRSRKCVRESGELRAQDLPLPDITIGRSPAWRQSTIDTWNANRAGPGRPRSDEA